MDQTARPAPTPDSASTASPAGSAPVGAFQPWRCLWRVPALAGVCLVGFPLMLLALLPGLRDVSVAGRPLGWRMQRRTARMVLFVLGMRYRRFGEVPEGPMLVVANHISWFDIPLLHAMSPIWLVAKSGIRDWPLVGGLARAVGTIFIERGSDASRRRASRRMAALLQHGKMVGVFPEAGIRAERGVGRFHARLLAPAVRTGTPLLPVAIRYWRDGDVHDERVFGPGTTFLSLLVTNLVRPPCEAQLIIGTPIAPGEAGRSDLAREAEEQVRRMYDHEIA